MRCYTVTEATITPSIVVAATPYPHIPVGEEGRGRELIRFPVGQRFADTLAYQAPCPQRGELLWKEESCSRCGVQTALAPGMTTYFRHPEAGEVTRYHAVERASVLRTKEKGTLLLVEERDAADRRALVLADIPAGFRGATSWTGTEKGPIPCPDRGKKLGSLDLNGTDRCPKCGVVCPLEEGAEFFRTHPDEGVAEGWQRFQDIPGVTVMAEGYKAQGDAGGMGGHAVRLLLLEPGSAFRVLRKGRLYGAPASRFVLWDGETLRLGTADEVWPPSCEEPEGEVI